MLFPLGSLIQLKAGGPVMTVVGHMTAPEVKLSCEWLRDDLREDNAWFRPSEVRLVK